VAKDRREGIFEWDAERVKRWQEAIVAALPRGLRDVIGWIHDPTIDADRLRELARHLSNGTPLAVAGIETYWHMLTQACQRARPEELPS
jgi:hypothetical protein